MAIPRSSGGGRLDGIWFPAEGEARGAVLLAHPWLEWGQTYFFRRGRIEALRQAGYDTLTFDFPGFGGSGPPNGFFDRDLEDALKVLCERSRGLPLHIWGVSAGGFWAHTVLSGSNLVAGAFFEDVSPHLIEWSRRVNPRGRPAFAFFRLAFPHAYRFLDLRRHAPFLSARTAAYAGGADDPGIPAGDLRELARLASARCLIVPDAGHLAAIKVAGDEVRSLALASFAAAEGTEDP